MCMSKIALPLSLALSGHLAVAGPQAAEARPSPTVVHAGAFATVQLPAGSDAASRRAAEALAAFGQARRDPAIIIGAVGALIATGARLTPDDPWGVTALLDEATALASDDVAQLALIDELRNRAARGAIDGPIRTDLTLTPGESASFEILVAAGELADIEGRVKAGSLNADLDLVVRDGNGIEVASERGPKTGVLGYSVYVGWTPETCARYTVEIRNAGSGTAALALLTSRASTQICETEPQR